jgi:ribosomal protein S18 acetylase RimI-like enzyme
LNEKGIILDELIEYLKEVDYDFNPSLSSRKDLVKYAKKIYENSLILSRRQNNRIIALLACYCNNEDAYLSIISVKKDFTGRGYFRNLMNDLIDYLRTEDFQKLELEVNKKNDKAYNAYIRMGFKYKKESSEPNHLILSYQLI